LAHLAARRRQACWKTIARSRILFSYSRRAFALQAAASPRPVLHLAFCHVWTELSCQLQYRSVRLERSLWSMASIDCMLRHKWGQAVSSSQPARRPLVRSLSTGNTFCRSERRRSMRPTENIRPLHAACPPRICCQSRGHGAWFATGYACKLCETIQLFSA
jgi:hypothetical protein